MHHKIGILTKTNDIFPVTIEKVLPSPVARSASATGLMERKQSQEARQRYLVPLKLHNQLLKRKELTIGTNLRKKSLLKAMSMTQQNERF